jgi:superfamily I DNA/RNA helicase
VIPPIDTNRVTLEQHREAAVAEQARVVATAAPCAVIACPGAGKTRVIVDRHCASPKGEPTGRAIASFTKVAAAQIRTRAHQLGRSDLLEHPHAITTLDGFFWRFLVRPFLPQPTTSNPRPFRRLESWRDAPRELRQITYRPDPRNPQVRHAFDLAEFQFRYAAGGPAPVAALAGLERVERGRKNLTDDQIAEVCHLAAERRTALANNEHMFTGEETRRAAYKYLTTHAASWLTHSRSDSTNSSSTRPKTAPTPTSNSCSESPRLVFRFSSSPTRTKPYMGSAPRVLRR